MVSGMRKFTQAMPCLPAACPLSVKSIDRLDRRKNLDERWVEAGFEAAASGQLCVVRTNDGNGYLIIVIIFDYLTM